MLHSEHVVLVDKKLDKIPLESIHDHLLTLNLHCNIIKTIANLTNLPYLTSLDLSANKLTFISGLEALVSLNYLNLASNFISEVQNLAGLKQLQLINLSYNRVYSLSGFVDLHGLQSCLTVIILHGNKLDDRNHLVRCLDGLVSLQHLVLNLEGHSNPLVDLPHYRYDIFNQLSQLVSLDCVNQSGDLIDIEENLSCQIYSCENLFHNKSKDQNFLSTSHSAVESKCVEASSFGIGFDDFISSTDISFTGIDKTCARQDVDKASQQVSDKNCNDFYLYKHTSKKKIKNNTPSKIVKHSINRKSKFFLNVKDKESYSNILKELEIERERRWKAEEANRKLALVLHDIKSNFFEKKSMEESVTLITDRMKKALLAEKQSVEQLKIDNRSKEGKIELLNEKLTTLNEEKCTTIHNLQNALANSNSKFLRFHSAFSKEKINLKDRFQDLEKKYQEVCSENSRLLKNLHQSSNIICPCIKKNSDGHDAAINSKDCVVATEVNALKMKHEKEMALKEQKLIIVQSNLSNLEAEFKDALLIESKRYNSLLDKYKVVCDNTSKLESILSITSDKEEKYRSIISEMTEIIKEQKIKAAEIFKSKEDVKQFYEKRLDSLQSQLNDSKKKVQDFQLISTEKSHLFSKCSALQSVIDGLKEERKVWGRELAEQGATLSKDRGRLEMKIEALKLETEHLRKTNERDLDALKIKSKIVDDQTETIFKMKEALTSKDKEIKVKLHEQLIEQQKLHDTIEDMNKENQRLQDANDKLLQRKEQLKAELSDLNKNFEKLEIVHDNQKSKWQEKGALISKLERQIKQVSLANQRKHDEILKEKEEALKATEILKDKNNDLYIAFQDQLHTANKLHQKAIERVQRDKEEELSRMRKKVERIESEMIDLLQETDIKKKSMEVKAGKLKALLEEIS